MSSSQPSRRIIEEETLADTAEKVLLLLFCCKKIRDEKARTLAAVQMSHFKSWAFNIGVFATRHASLDYRLRTAPTSRALVETNLDTVCKRLLGTLKGSSKVSNDEFDALLNAPRSQVLPDTRAMLLKSTFNSSMRINQLKLVDAMINTLCQNSLAIQRAVNRKTLVEIPRLLDFDKEYVVIREQRGDSANPGSLIDGIRFDIGTGFEDFLREALTHKWFRFHSSDEKDFNDGQRCYRQMLLERCVTTISARRRQLAYFQAHYSHEDTFASELKVASFKPQWSNLVPYSSLSTFADDRFGFRFGGPFDIPPPPKLAGNEEEKACPYCCLVLPAKTFSMQKRAGRWEQHLLDDLQPYICLFSNCDQPGRTYSSFTECRQHIIQAHYRSWECSLHTKDGISDAANEKVLTFDTLKKLEMHLRISHPGLDPSSASDPLQHKRQMDIWPRWCFVCCQVIPEFEKLLKHIASHLESMSLLALPWRDDIVVEEAIASDRATCSVATDDVQLDRIGFCSCDKTDEVMIDPVRKLGKREFASLLLAVNEIPQVRLQTLEPWAQDSCLNVPGWRRVRRNWSLALIVVKTITELRKNTACWQARCRGPRIRDSMPWYRNYTVGWICALPFEFEASKAILDYRYRQPFQGHGNDPDESYDGDSYAYGRIGHHDVAIACMSSDYYETSSVSDVLKDMREFFPFLRFFFMDIRLRDVTGGDPVINSGAGIQYDPGRIERRGVFVQTGSLNTSMLPEDLQTAIRALKADHQIGHKSSEHLQAIFKRYNKANIRYGQPNVKNDALYSIYDDHFDTEASGNDIMKHGATRDGLWREHGIKCLEREVTGSTDGFHCLVIRGISDYADSHRNDIWQPCAAAIAAEYAKELLQIFPPVPSAICPDVWYRLTRYLSYTESIDIEEDSTSTDGNMRITLALNDANQVSHVLGVHPGDETRLRLEPAAFVSGQQWQIVQRGGGAVSIRNRLLGSGGYLGTKGYPAELTLSEKNENDASQLWRLHPVGIVGRQSSHSDDMMIDL
ncbi:hypothetical protein GGI35DRAFT_470623 [Trichoderma velutinum]